MKAYFFLVLLSLSALSPVLAQDETPAPMPATETPVITSTPSPTASPTPTHTSPKCEWADRFGLGLSQISVRPYQYYFAYQPVDSLTLISIRYGLSDRFLLEVLLGGTAGTNVGYDIYGYPTVNDPYWAYCYGLGVKTNLVRPFDGFWVQALTRFLYFENSAQSSLDNYTLTSDVLSDHYQSLSVAAGLGFEYFLPFLKNLSLETSETVEFDTNWETYTDTSRKTSKVTTENYSTWVLQVVSPGFNLTSLSIHYYF